MATPPSNPSNDIPAQDPSQGLDAGINVLYPFPPVKVTILDRDTHLKATLDDSKPKDSDGQRLPAFAFTARPEPTPPDHEVPGVTNTSKSKPSAVFLPDQRYTFADSNFPWSLVGKVRTSGGWGSGTVIGPRHILTASHVINWTRDSAGNIGWVSFTPAYYDGRGPWGEFYATEVLSWRENGHTLSDEQTAFDFAILVLAQPINNKVGGFAGAREYSSDWNGKELWQGIGYPGDLNGGERPAFQGSCIISSRDDWTYKSRKGSVLGNFNDTYGGQSGGPVWATWSGEAWPRVVGVVSTEAKVPKLGSKDGDNEYGGGAAMVDLIVWAKDNRP